jgi:hypothetical protein
MTSTGLLKEGPGSDYSREDPTNPFFLRTNSSAKLRYFSSDIRSSWIEFEKSKHWVTAQNQFTVGFSSRDRSEHRPNACGHCHGERTPESDPYCAHRHRCTTSMCSQPAEKCEEHKRSSRNKRDQPDYGAKAVAKCGMPAPTASYSIQGQFMGIHSEYAFLAA